MPEGQQAAPECAETHAGCPEHLRNRHLKTEGGRGALVNLEIRLACDEWCGKRLKGCTRLMSLRWNWVSNVHHLFSFEVYYVIIQVNLMPKVSSNKCSPAVWLAD